MLVKRSRRMNVFALLLAIVGVAAVDTVNDVAVEDSVDAFENAREHLVKYPLGQRASQLLHLDAFDKEAFDNVRYSFPFSVCVVSLEGVLP